MLIRAFRLGRFWPILDMMFLDGCLIRRDRVCFCCNLFEVKCYLAPPTTTLPQIFFPKYHCSLFFFFYSSKEGLKMSQPALVSVKWLAEKLANACKNYRVLDASWHLPNTGRNAKAEYQQEHIKDALFFDIDECADKTKSTAHMIPTPKDFEQYVGDLGVGNDTHVILYDNNPKFGIFSAQRVWWTFRLFGHNAVSILEGGLPSWKSQGQPVTSDVTPPVQRQVFQSKFRPELVKSFEQVEENIETKSFQLVDARPSGRFQGTSPEPRADIKPGHIPNSTNIPFIDILDENTRTAHKVDQLKKLFSDAGVDLQKPVVASCGSGISACTIALAAFICGKEDVSIYDGSWVEWYQRAKKEQKVNCPD